MPLIAHTDKLSDRRVMEAILDLLLNAQDNFHHSAWSRCSKILERQEIEYHVTGNELLDD